MLGIALVLLVAVVSIAQTGPPVVEVGLRVEAAWVGRGDQPAGVPRSMQQSLPDGAAEWNITTDGVSMRSALRGRYLNLPSGIIVLQRDGEANRYVLNPADQTFYTRPAEGAPADEALEDIKVVQSSDVDDIAGFKAQKVVIEFRRPLPAEVKNAGGPSHMQTEIVNWCASDLGLPSILTTAIDRRVQTFTPRQLGEQVTKVCRAALRSSYRLVSSSSRDYAIVSTVTSIKRVSPGTNLFAVPEGYRKILPQ